MAWVVDVSRCLGLIELKGCPRAADRQRQQTGPGHRKHHQSHTISRDGVHHQSQPIITNDVTCSSPVTGHESLAIAALSLTNNNVPAKAVTSHTCDNTEERNSCNCFCTAGTSATLTDSTKRPLTLASCAGDGNVLFGGAGAAAADNKNLNRFGSLSTPCLQEKLLSCVHEQILPTYNFATTPTLSTSNLSDADISHSNCNSLASNSTGVPTFSSNRYSYTQSCETLSPLPRPRPAKQASACRRHIVLSRADCTVQYSPIAAFTNDTTSAAANSNQQSDNEHCALNNSGGGAITTTPRSSHRFHEPRLRAVSSSSLTTNDGRHALMNRVCGGGGAGGGPGSTTVPPLPATDHPSRPPRMMNLFCSAQQHHFILPGKPQQPYHLLRNHSADRGGCSSSAAASRSGSLREDEVLGPPPRRAVRSAVMVPGLEPRLSAAARSFSEHVLAGAGATNPEIFRKFEENRTSSLRGPPSRAASAEYLLDTLNLSEVSVGDNTNGATSSDVTYSSANDRLQDNCCTNPSRCSSTSCIHYPGNSRQSLGSVASSLESTSTSVTTISCSGVGPHHLEQDLQSSEAGLPSATRNSFHAASAARAVGAGNSAAAAAKIRRCQSDVAGSSSITSNNINNNNRLQHLGVSSVNSGSNSTSITSSIGSSNGPPYQPCPGRCPSRGCGGRGRQVDEAATLHRLGSHDEPTMQRTRSLKRSKGSTHLRRSVSQPLDLNKSVLESPRCGGAGHTSCGGTGHHHPHHPNRPQRRPSTGDLLGEAHTTSEEETAGSDGEERREHDLDGSCSVVYAEALWDHVTLDNEELVFHAGELISVVDRTDQDWWWGRINHRAGWFPVAFVRLLVNQQEHLSSSQELDVPECEELVLPEEGDESCLDVLEASLSDGEAGLSESMLGRQVNRALSQQSAVTPRKGSVSGLSHDHTRANVIKEIITTERDFVKHLRDVVEGYLKQARRRPDMFSPARISTIFGNMEELFAFQTAFLKDLEECINWDALHLSCVGEAFIKNSDKFEIYSEYCNNHPFAVSELQELYQQEKYVHFFEACRLLQEMIDISLDGFLLTPVQKICKYPLQLQELLKYTKPEHPDHTSVEGALSAMRAAALLVNERRRRLECLEKIAAWQMTLEGWEGAELLDSSSQLIHQGEVVKGAGSSWPKEVTLFLFDRLLVYCKKDLIKRNTYVYRGRVNLDQCAVEDISEIKDGGRGSGVANAWKIHCHDKNKSYVFASKTHEEKIKWLEALRRERQLVAGDRQAGFLVSNKTRELAWKAAHNRRARPKKPRTSKVHKRSQALTHAQAAQLVNIDRELRSNSLPSHQQQQQQQLSSTVPLAADTSDNKKRGLWFSFGGQKKSRSQTRGNDLQQPTPV